MLLGLPIGMFLHLVFDGAWTNTDVFWWPFTGLSFDGNPWPITDRGVMSVLLELVGLALCTWIWRNNKLGAAENRRRFMENGRLVAVPGN